MWPLVCICDECAVQAAIPPTSVVDPGNVWGNPAGTPMCTPGGAPTGSEGMALAAFPN